MRQRGNGVSEKGDGEYRTIISIRACFSRTKVNRPSKDGRYEIRVEILKQVQNDRG